MECQLVLCIHIVTYIYFFIQAFDIFIYILRTQWIFLALDTRPLRYIGYSPFPRRPLCGSAESPIRALSMTKMASIEHLIWTIATFAEYMNKQLVPEVDEMVGDCRGVFSMKFFKF